MQTLASSVVKLHHINNVWFPVYLWGLSEAWRDYVYKDQGPDILIILRQSWEFYTLPADKVKMNSLNVINMTKYINVNNKTSFIYVILQNYH